MNLCLALIQDELPVATELLQREETPGSTRFAFVQEAKTLEAGIVYLASAQDLPEELDYEKGAALICIGKPADNYLPAGLPVLAVLDDIDLFTLANELGAVFLKYNDLEMRLNEAVHTGRGLQELVDIMTPYLKNELSIADSNHMILAHSFEELRMTRNEDMDMSDGKKMLPVEVISFFINNKRWVEMKTEKEPFIYDEGIFAHRLLCFNIITEVEFICRVTIGETEQPFRSYDPHLLRFFAEYVRIVYVGSLPWNDTHEINSLRDSLRSTLSGAEVEPWRIQHGLQVMGYAKDANFLCLCIKPEYWDYSNNTITYYCEQLQRLFVGVVPFEYLGDIICLVNLDLNGSSEEPFLKTITPFIRDNNFRAGVSELFDDVNAFKDHYRQAEIALSYGIAEKPSKWVHRFREQAVDYIVSRASKYAGVKTLCAEKVLRLYEYDAKNDSSYVKTIEAYFNNHLNIVRAAANLNIHRATMVYRLKRIEELSGIDFQDDENNLFYWLSIRLLRLTDENFIERIDQPKK